MISTFLFIYQHNISIVGTAQDKLPAKIPLAQGDFCGLLSGMKRLSNVFY
jgi:hypothetical protein